MLRNDESLQRLLRFQRHRSSNCADRGTEFCWREGPSRSPLPRSLQHHTEPVANICEKETRIVSHTVDGFEYRKSARVFSSDFSQFRGLPPWTPVFQNEPTVSGFYPLKYNDFDLQKALSLSEIPACRGPEILGLLVELNPIQEPELQSYPARVEKFCSNFVIRKLLATSRSHSSKQPLSACLTPTR